MNWQERITVDPAILVGKPIVKGTRIAVEFVIDLMARGWTNEQILKEYDHLKPEDIQACLAYAGWLHNNPNALAAVRQGLREAANGQFAEAPDLGTDETEGNTKDG